MTFLRAELGNTSGNVTNSPIVAGDCVCQTPEIPTVTVNQTALTDFFDNITQLYDQTAVNWLEIQNLKDDQDSLNVTLQAVLNRVDQNQNAIGQVNESARQLLEEHRANLTEEVSRVRESHVSLTAATESLTAQAENLRNGVTGLRDSSEETDSTLRSVGEELADLKSTHRTDVADINDRLNGAKKLSMSREVFLISAAVHVLYLTCTFFL